jgi:translation initiation factor IF-3
MNTEKALALAQERGVDLVEVSPAATPPVCRLMDYGKFRYLQKKKQQEAKKRQQVIEVKEIKLRPLIDRHDLENKLRSAREFLSEGNKVKFNVFFRGREIAHPEIAEELLRRIIENLGDKARVESPPALDGRRMVMVIAPSAGKKAEPKPLSPQRETAS